MKSFKRILPFLAVLMMLGISGCRSVDKLKDIRVTSWSLESVMPSGLRSLDAEIAVGIENPAMEFTLEDIGGVLYYRGAEFVGYTAEPVRVEGRCTAVYPVRGSAQLIGNFSLLDVLAIARNYDPADFTTDIHAKVRLKSGVSKNINLTGVPVKALIR